MRNCSVLMFNRCLKCNLLRLYVCFVFNYDEIVQRFQMKWSSTGWYASKHLGYFERTIWRLTGDTRGIVFHFENYFEWLRIGLLLVWSRSKTQPIPNAFTNYVKSLTKYFDRSGRISNLPHVILLSSQRLNNLNILIIKTRRLGYS